jgi:hypothetical protein
VASVSGSTVTGNSSGTANISGSGWTYTPNSAPNCVLSSQALIVNPPTPGNPGGITAGSSCPATSGVNLSWTAGSNATSYNIYRYTSNTVSSATVIGTTSSTSYTDNSSGGPYYYWVQSVNITGSSALVAASSNSTGGATPTCGPIPPTGGTTSNSSGCNLVTLNWTDNSTNETGFYIYRDSTSTAPIVNNVPASSPTSATGPMSYTFSPTPDNNPHTYYIAAFNASGVSAAVAEAGGSVASNACVANLTSSNKEITAINGSAVSGASSYVCQGQTNPLSSTSLPNNGDAITFAINVCNNSASSYVPATITTLVDSMTNLQQPSGGWNAQYCLANACSSVTPTVSGTAPNQTLTFTLNKTVPFGVNAAPGILTYNAVITPQSSGAYGRFQNGAIINYGSGLSYPVNTPLILYYNGTQTPIRNETPPN